MDSNINLHATVPLNQFCHETQRLEDTASRRLEKWKCIRKSSDVPLEKWKGMRGQYSVAKWMQMAQEILFINQGSLEDDIFMTSYDRWHRNLQLDYKRRPCSLTGPSVQSLCWASLWRWQTQVFLLQHWGVELGELCFLLVYEEITNSPKHWDGNKNQRSNDFLSMYFVQTVSNFEMLWSSATSTIQYPTLGSSFGFIPASHMQ